MLNVLKKLGKKTGVKPTLADMVVNDIVGESPFYASPSFIQHGGKYSTIVQLYVRQNTNRNMTFNDVIDLIPSDLSSNIKMRLFVKDVLITGDEKKKLIMTNASGGKNVIDDTLKNGKKEENENTAAVERQLSELDDYADYETIIDSADPVVGFQIRLLITGFTREAVEDQLQAINVALDQRHEGARFDSLGGCQLSWLNQLYDTITPSRFDMTSTGENYAGLNFMIDSGMCDPMGVPVGVDIMSPTGTTSFFDFDKTINKQMIIASPASSYMPAYLMDGEPYQFELSSLLAQRAANQIVLNGKRVHHMVLNRFDYCNQDYGNIFVRPIEVADIFPTFNVAELTINPLQGFGDYSEISAVFNRLIHKIVNIFNILEDLKLSQEEKAIILSAVEAFYFNHSLWNADAEIYPKRTRIINIANPETYPTLGLMINEFTTLARQASQNNRELRADKIDTIYSILNSALMSYMGVLGRHTSIPATDSAQTYYSFANLDSAKIVQIQFLNMLPYIIWTAQPGDVIMIHGMQKLYNSTARMVAETIQSAQNKGIRFVYCFDTVTSMQGQVDKMLDMFDMQGLYYHDIDTDVDAVILGRCRSDEIKMFEKAMDKKLSPIVQSQLGSRMVNQMLFHRAIDNTNNFVYTNVLI